MLEEVLGKADEIVYGKIVDDSFCVALRIFVKCKGNGAVWERYLKTWKK